MFTPVKSSYGTSVEWTGKEARLVSYFPIVGKGESVALQTFIENYVREICFEVRYTKQIKKHVATRNAHRRSER